MSYEATRKPAMVGLSINLGDLKFPYRLKKLASIAHEMGFSAQKAIRQELSKKQLEMLDSTKTKIIVV